MRYTRPKKFDARFKIATILIVLVYIGIIFFTANLPTNRLEVLVAAAAAITTVYFGLIKYWMEEDKIFKELFEFFNQRFDEIGKKLNKICDDQHNSDDLKEQKKKDKQIIQSYLNLCAEEYYWYKKGRIPEEVWQAWEVGIRYFLKRSDLIDDFFRQEAKNNISYYGFFTDFRFIDAVADPKADV